MSALLFLTDNDFKIVDGVKGPIMCHSISGLSLILFYSINCPHCQSLIPIFKSLPRYIGACQFGMVNVDTNSNCINMSKHTIAPITFVPYIVLYSNGRPYIRYNGPYNRDELLKFVSEIAKKMQTKQQFVVEKPNKMETIIPEYTVGKPLKGNPDDNVCYLTFTSAYSSK